MNKWTNENAKMKSVKRLRSSQKESILPIADKRNLLLKEKASWPQKQSNLKKVTRSWTQKKQKTNARLQGRRSMGEAKENKEVIVQKRYS